MDDNPWNVDSVNAFYFLKCPECIFDTQEEYTFRDHAVENHPLSFVLFGKQSDEDEFDTSFESPNYDHEQSNVVKKFDINEDINNSQLFQIKKESPETDSISSHDLFSCMEQKLEVDGKLQSEIKLFPCSQCENSFSNKSDLKFHIRTVHKHVCSLCGKSFPRPGKLKLHVSAVHEKSKPFGCSVCDYTCATKSALTEHVSNVHEKSHSF